MICDKHNTYAYVYEYSHIYIYIYVGKTLFAESRDMVERGTIKQRSWWAFGPLWAGPAWAGP